MKRRVMIIVLALALAFAIFGWNPFASYRDTSALLGDERTEFETGINRQANGVYRVRALTEMPDVKARMVKWWFADYMQTTEHYKRWHPTAHVWMDWENKTPGNVIGASHLVHEYIGEDLHKLRIQFVEPSSILGEVDTREDRFIICAKAGDLEEPMNFTTMCHIVHDTETGAEMRSVFWLGHVSKRDGNENVFSVTGLIANTWLARNVLLKETFAADLKTHAIEEMGTLAGFLPQLYAEENS